MKMFLVEYLVDRLFKGNVSHLKGRQASDRFVVFFGRLFLQKFLFDFRDFFSVRVAQIRDQVRLEVRQDGLALSHEFFVRAHRQDKVVVVGN
jgi:hypothetical protein